MQTFYMIIGKNKLSLYEKKNNSLEKLYVEGNPEYLYEINNAKRYIEQLLLYLVNEYNLNTKAEIDVIVIDNEDIIISNSMNKVLKEYIKEKYSIDSLMVDISKKLGRDKKLYISEFGINFDGKNYLVSGKELKKNEFSLLGYTINNDELIKYIG